MPIVKDSALVLRRLDYSETSQVLVVFTRAHGQQRVIAKGVKRSTKKRASVGIDLLEMGDIAFSQRTDRGDVLATLTEWRQEDSFPHLRGDLVRLYAAQYAAEVTAQLTEVNDPHAALYDALAALLRDLGEVEPLDGLVRFLWVLLREVGIVPELSRCMNCGKAVADDRVLFFSSRAGGAICRDCEPHVVEKRRVDPAAAAMLTTLSTASIPVTHSMASDRPDRPALDARVVRHAFDLLDYHLTETMGKPARLKPALLAALTLPKGTSMG